MKNNVLVVVLVVLIGLLSGVALLLGINSTMQMALAPVEARLNNIEATQKVILDKLQSSPESASGVGGQLTVIQNQLKFLQGKLGNLPSFNPPAPPAEDMNKVHTIDIGTSPIYGKKDAPITIFEFTDLQCPFCARFHPALKEVVKAYPDKVKVVLKNFPLSFHPNARPAAKLAFAANEQGKYYEMIELLLQNGAGVTEEKIKEYASTLKLDHNKLVKDLKDKDAEYEKRVADDIALGQKIEVRGTPTFFINGKKTTARDFEGYKAEVERILAGK